MLGRPKQKEMPYMKILNSVTLRMLPALMLITVLTSCSTTQTAGSELSAYCNIACEKQWSLDDTDESIAQDRMNNAAYRALCPPKPCVIDAVMVEHIKKSKAKINAKKSPP